MATGRGRLMPAPVCIYDGDCGFCRRSVVLARGIVGSTVDFQPSQEVASIYPQITAEAFERAVQFIDEEGHVSEGAEAVFRCLSRSSGFGWLLLLYLRFGWFRTVSEFSYTMVARHRGVVSAFTHWTIGPQLQIQSLTRLRWLLLRLMGLVYLLAFASLLPQLLGLIGSKGILPFDQLMQRVEQAGGGWSQIPTLLWLLPTDQGLLGLCWLGLVGSLFLLTNRWTRLASLVCWLCYLSIYSVAQNFLWLQWDLLLLESGFLTLLLAAGSSGQGFAWHRPPRWITLFLFRCLAFRLLWSSGIVKLASGDPTWAYSNALVSHFETQPLPNLGAWYAHQLPETLLIWGTGITLLLETVIPLLFFAPRRLRSLAAILSMGLMLAIIATGNYGFFNILSLVLLISLLDDEHLLWLGRRLRRQNEPPKQFDPRRVPLARRPRFSPASWAFGALFAYVGLTHMATGMGWNNWITAPGAAAAKGLEQFSIVGRYGLFASMTDGRASEADRACQELEVGDACQFEVLDTTYRGRCGERQQRRRCEPVGGRIELRIEGSLDGKSWAPYRLPYKPEAVAAAPKQIAPHMPRLDWLMWFAALHPAQRPPHWFQQLLFSLLEARPAVLELFDTTPFGSERPRYLRVQAMEYRFTRNNEEAYWNQRPRGLWLQPIRLEASP